MTLKERINKLWFTKKGKTNPVTALNPIFKKRNEDGREIYVFDRKWQIFVAKYKEENLTVDESTDGTIPQWKRTYCKDRIIMIRFLEQLPEVESICSYSGSLTFPESPSNLNCIYGLCSNGTLSSIQRKASAAGIAFSFEKRKLEDFYNASVSPDGDSRHVPVALMMNRIFKLDSDGNVIYDHSLDTELVVFNKEWNPKKREDHSKGICYDMIVGLKIALSKGCYVDMSVQTYSPLQEMLKIVRSEIKKTAIYKMPRFHRVNNGVSTYLIPYYEPEINEDVFVKRTMTKSDRHTIEDEVFNGKGKEEERCKTGVFWSIMQDLQFAYSDVCEINVERTSFIESRKYFSKTSREKIFKENVQKSGLIKKLRFVNVLSEYDDMRTYINALKKAFAEFFNTSSESFDESTTTDNESINLVVVHEKEYYKRIEEHDPRSDGNYSQSLTSSVIQNVTVETLKNAMEQYERSCKRNFMAKKKKNPDANLGEYVAQNKVPPFLVMMLVNELLVKNEMLEKTMSYKHDKDIAFAIKKNIVLNTSSGHKKRQTIPVFIALEMKNNAEKFSIYHSVNSLDADFGTFTNELNKAFKCLNGSEKFAIVTHDAIGILEQAPFKCIRDYSGKTGKGIGTKSREYHDEYMPGLYDMNLFSFRGSHYIIVGGYSESYQNYVIDKTSRPRKIVTLKGDAVTLAKDIMTCMGEIYLSQNRATVYPFTHKLLNEYFNAWLVDNKKYKSLEQVVAEEAEKEEDPTPLFLFDNDDETAGADEKENDKKIIGIVFPSKDFEKLHRFKDDYSMTIQDAIRYLLRLSYGLQISPVIHKNKTLFTLPEASGRYKIIIEVGNTLYNIINKDAAAQKKKMAQIIRQRLTQQLEQQK